MNINNYFPTFRNVLFREVVKEMTDTGLYLPTKDMELKGFSSMFENESVQFKGSETKLGDYVVVKTGTHCELVKPGDVIILMTGIRAESIEFEDGTYLQVMEQQIIGYSRENNLTKENGSISDALKPQPEVTRSS